LRLLVALLGSWPSHRRTGGLCPLPQRLSRKNKKKIKEEREKKKKEKKKKKKVRFPLLSHPFLAGLVAPSPRASAYVENAVAVQVFEDSEIFASCLHARYAHERGLRASESPWGGGGGGGGGGVGGGWGGVGGGGGRGGGGGGGGGGHYRS